MSHDYQPSSTFPGTYSWRQGNLHLPFYSLSFPNRRKLVFPLLRFFPVLTEGVAIFIFIFIFIFILIENAKYDGILVLGVHEYGFGVVKGH